MQPPPPPTTVATQIRTSRVATFVRQPRGRTGGEPVLLIHGNLSSSVFFEPLMSLLPTRFRPLAIDLRGSGGSDPEPVDATRGVRDFSDDVLAAMDALELDRAHIVGWSFGGAVAMQAAIDAPERLLSMTLIAPVSPFGFGGTVDEAGTLLAPDGAGSGPGLVSRRLVRSLVDHDASAGDPARARMLLRRFYLSGSESLAPEPGAAGISEDDLVAAMLSTEVGPENYPGERVDSPNWPGFAPGSTGVMNAVSPKYCDLSAFSQIDPKPPVLWMRGDADRIISDESVMDVAVRGLAGRFDGYPGIDVAPPQPMVSQTRRVLDAYADGGGVCREAVIAGAGHTPHVTAVDRVAELLVAHLDGATRE